ncbi:centriolin-like isoform X3 [Gadus macrocephalus]|uniref:centriolin-like isoform X3 n=1 Tax=Gadus macrocephalus TaxID=80720 RepID=UPI0028CB9190|nr:centriolin-like isoform X3 [Gadus macrocephalus]
MGRTVHQSECVVLMAMMTSKKHQELEVRLEDMLSRIAMETLEIKQLEQQLTEGQILVNEALQVDLQGIISGIQEYIGGLRQQVCQAQDEARCLGIQNQALQRQLDAVKLHCRRLETEARTHRQQFQDGLDQLLQALISGQDCFSSHGLEDLFSDRLRQMYQGIQQYVADQIRRAQEQSQHTKDQQVRDQHIQGERLRADSQGACEALLNSQAQVQNLQHMMAEVLSRREKCSKSMSESQRHTDLTIRWTTQQLRALSDTLEQLEPHQEPPDSGLGLHYLSSPEGGRSDIKVPPRLDHYSVDDNPTDTDAGKGGATCLPAGIADSQEPLCGCSPSPACNLPEHTDLIDRLEEQRKRLEEERKMIHLGRKPLRCVCLCEEVQCVEHTLLKRRAELRQADRRLMDAQSCLHNTRHKARCVQRQLVLSQSELEGLKHRLDESATCLLQTKQQLWQTEAELQQVKGRRSRGKRR